MRTISLVIVLFFVVAPSLLIAQTNLLPNGGFEEVKIETDSMISFQDSSGLVKKAKVDTINIADKLVQIDANYWNPTNLKIPINCIYQSEKNYSHSGKNFALITPYDFTTDEGLFVRNLVGQICKPLVKGNIYQISFYIKAFSGNAFMSGIEVAVSNFRYPVSYYFTEHALQKNQQEKYPAVSYRINDFIDNREYHLIHFQYKAEGGERYIYIGNFHLGYLNKSQLKPTAQFGFYKNKDAPTEAVYAIDDISIIATDSSENCLSFSISKDSSVAIPDTIKLGDLYFDFDVSNFSKDLKKIMGQLKKVENYKQIILTGYTDSKGSVNYNKQLSKSRAEYVFNALKTTTSMEILIEAKGESERKPTDAMERRVEIKIVR